MIHHHQNAYIHVNYIRFLGSTDPDPAPVSVPVHIPRLYLSIHQSIHLSWFWLHFLRYRDYWGAPGVHIRRGVNKCQVWWRVKYIRTLCRIIIYIYPLFLVFSGCYYINSIYANALPVFCISVATHENLVIEYQAPRPFFSHHDITPHDTALIL